MSSVLQDWVTRLPLMQQSVLLAALRGPDGVHKLHKSKLLCRWLRRCVVVSAFDGRALDTPYDPGGGSYTGPSCTGEDEFWEDRMDGVVKEYLSSVDDLPHHFHLHFMHAAEVLGYKHGDARIRMWWAKTYRRFAHDMHMTPETREQLDYRLDETRYKP